MPAATNHSCNVVVAYSVTLRCIASHLANVTL